MMVRRFGEDEQRKKGAESVQQFSGQWREAGCSMAAASSDGTTTRQQLSGSSKFQFFQAPRLASSLPASAFNTASNSSRCAHVQQLSDALFLPLDSETVQVLVGFQGSTEVLQQQRVTV